MSAEAEAVMESLSFDAEEASQREEEERLYWAEASVREAELAEYERQRDHERWIKENGRSGW